MVEYDFFKKITYNNDKETYIENSPFMEKEIEGIKIENKNILFRLGENKQESISKIIPALKYLKEKV